MVASTTANSGRWRISTQATSISGAITPSSRVTQIGPRAAKKASHHQAATQPRGEETVRRHKATALSPYTNTVQSTW